VLSRKPHPKQFPKASRTKSSIESRATTNDNNKAVRERREERVSSWFLASRPLSYRTAPHVIGSDVDVDVDGDRLIGLGGLGFDGGVLGCA
jgi:hypothetical protein